jgi:hypothetical protein
VQGWGDLAADIAAFVGVALEDVVVVDDRGAERWEIR